MPPPAGANPASWLLLASGGEACAEDLCKCLAFDIVLEDAPGILRIALESCGVRPRAPPNPTIREFTVELARTAGFKASKRQPLPGVLKFWSAWAIFAPHMQYHQTLEARRMKNESTVGY